MHEVHLQDTHDVSIDLSGRIMPQSTVAFLNESIFPALRGRCVALNLTGCGLGDAAVEIVSAMTSLANCVLKLDYNDISDVTVFKIANVLKSQGFVSEISLVGNPFTENGSLAILQEGTGIHTVDISHSGFLLTEGSSAELLCDVLLTHPTLNQLSVTGEGLMEVTRRKLDGCCENNVYGNHPRLFVQSREPIIRVCTPKRLVPEISKKQESLDELLAENQKLKAELERLKAKKLRKRKAKSAKKADEKEKAPDSLCVPCQVHRRALTSHAVNPLPLSSLSKLRSFSKQTYQWK